MTGTDLVIAMLEMIKHVSLYIIGYDKYLDLTDLSNCRQPKPVAHSNLLFCVFGFDNLVGLPHKVKNFSVGNVTPEVELNPVFCHHVALTLY